MGSEQAADGWAKPTTLTERRGRIGSELGPRVPQTGGADSAPAESFGSARPDACSDPTAH